MTTIDVERLQFVDMRQQTRGNFMEPENITRFLSSEVGKAQERLMRDQMAAQMNAGVTGSGPRTKPEDIDISTIRRALFTEQASQDTGYRQADLTTKQLMDLKGPSWLQQLGDLVGNWGRAGKQGVEGAVRVGAEAIQTHVVTEGQTGEVARLRSGREVQIDNAVNEALGIKAPGTR